MEYSCLKKACTQNAFILSQLMRNKIIYLKNKKIKFFSNNKRNDKIKCESYQLLKYICNNNTQFLKEIYKIKLNVDKKLQTFYADRMPVKFLTKQRFLFIQAYYSLKIELLQLLASRLFLHLKIRKKIQYK